MSSVCQTYANTSQRGRAPQSPSVVLMLEVAETEVEEVVILMTTLVETMIASRVPLVEILAGIVAVDVVVVISLYEYPYH